MTANKGKVLLQVQGLEKKFDDNQVLDGITTDICQGEVVAVIGPSGSGKSTFHRKHPSNTGRSSSVSICHDDTGFPHSKSSTKVTVSCKNRNITADTSADHTFHIALKTPPFTAS